MIVTTPKDAERKFSEAFVNFFRAYMEASDEAQEVIRDMFCVINDKTTDDDECEAAYATLAEALFPISHNGDLGICIDDLCNEESEDFQEEAAIAAREEASFSERLQSLLDKKGLTQSQLAEKLGLSQPAISMMIARKCRPQRRTVERIAQALNVEVELLWPTRP